LAAGVPLLCIPMGRDQNDTAARVVRSGAGIRLKPSVTADRILGAVELLLNQPSYRDGAQRMARAIASREGCSDAVECLERLCLQTDRPAAPADMCSEAEIAAPA